MVEKRGCCFPLLRESYSMIISIWKQRNESIDQSTSNWHEKIPRSIPYYAMSFVAAKQIPAANIFFHTAFQFISKRIPRHHSRKEAINRAKSEETCFVSDLSSYRYLLRYVSYVERSLVDTILVRTLLPLLDAPGPCLAFLSL